MPPAVLSAAIVQSYCHLLLPGEGGGGKVTLYFPSLIPVWVRIRYLQLASASHITPYIWC